MASNPPIDLTDPAAGFSSSNEATKFAVTQMSAAAESNGSTPPPTNPSVTSSPQGGEFPNDPATLSGARNNPLYLGPTNFSTIQKQYTPYQIEQATTRDASGNIFWKEGVDISKVPTAPPVTPFTAPTTVPTPSTSSLPDTTAPTPNITSDATASDAFAASQSQAAKTYLTGIQGAQDGLLAQQQALEKTLKDAQEAKVASLKGELTTITNANPAQDILKATREKFQVEQNMATLGIIGQKIADASAMLDQGILYEQNQPVRMSLLTGRSAALQRQGIASIGAMKMAAEVVKGNIDLARSYADDTIAAMKYDNGQKIDAINTLLQLENNKLVALTEDEKDTIASRMQLLKDEGDNIEKRKDDIFNLAAKYPMAFSKGGASFTDTRESALAKMLPIMSAQEQEQYDLDIQKQKMAIEKAGRTGSGGGSGSSSIVQEISDYIAYLRSLGKTEKEIREEVYSNFGGKLKTTELNGVVDNVLQGGVKDLQPKDVLANVNAVNELKDAGYDAQGNPLPEEAKEPSKVKEIALRAAKAFWGFVTSP